MLKKGRGPEPRDDKLTSGKIIGRIGIVAAVTAVIAAAAVCGAVYIIFRTPGNAVRRVTVTELRESALLSWVPELFLSPEEIEDITGDNTLPPKGQSGPLIPIQTDIPTADRTETAAQEDEKTDGETGGDDPEERETDGVFVTQLRENGFTGYLVTVKEPENVILGVPASYEESESKTNLEKLADRYEAPWAINAGSFGEDLKPKGYVISEGKSRCGEVDESATLAGLDESGVLHLGTMTAREALSAGIGNACVCESILILNGKALADSTANATGRGPLSAIGQKEDGTVLFLLIDGWQAASLGASREDAVSILMDNGAKNAALLGCGAESGLMLNGELHSAVPEESAEEPASAFVVLGE